MRFGISGLLIADGFKYPPRTRLPLILSVAETLKAALRCRANNRRIPYKYIFLFVNKKACAAAKYAMNGAIGSET